MEIGKSRPWKYYFLGMDLVQPEVVFDVIVFVEFRIPEFQQEANYKHLSGHLYNSKNGRGEVGWPGCALWCNNDVMVRGGAEKAGSRDYSFATMGDAWGSYVGCVAKVGLYFCLGC
jgi:hypothetical protein